ncbi:MAG: Rieske 2Fe-2S domain-containing protein [Candidatus Latescibacteria bacterium]|nr:Rieske 2Fe-2S domain-containing protein [Candidatus Latescibacterota bacterium]NIM22709.1 Rieske 2Fe-2S domain-containing protein [Candidatus Latescibacterota bacterium]NIM64998.1 Rieske 2Fe-2S domain-containing protein [Candidatus Latescibacterota bacterium]NIO01513.1 Rieske 2Fe-2S domain-containing protein [Candidatus Latescibacterota bacterium]NIO28022.1 Rieske 2Fe-2S domain-containing protein [Candidatus Latescibacterota bacterium]
MSDSSNNNHTSRRTFLRRAAGWLLGFGAVASTWPYLRSLIPNILYEPPKKFKIGKPEDYQQGVQFLVEHRIYLFREGDAFYAISGVCTHLGCTVKFSPFSQEREMTVRKKMYRSKGEFHCPCHGSKFHDEGTNFAGPAPRSLKCHRLEISPEDDQLVVNLSEEVDRDFRLVVR